MENIKHIYLYFFYYNVLYLICLKLSLYLYITITDADCSGLELCCKEGTKYAMQLVKMKENNIQVDVYTTCEEKVANLSNSELHSDCLRLIYKSCVTKFLELISGMLTCIY